MSSSSERNEHAQRRLPTWMRVTPYLAVLGVLAFLVFRSVSTDDEVPEDQTASDGAASAVVTFEEALELGLEVDFGPSCDPATGRVRLPIASAPPCVALLEDTVAGGSAPGVTPTEVTVAVYQTQVNPAIQGLLSGFGVSFGGPETIEAIDNYRTIFESVTETYGRTLRLVPLVASGFPTDAVAARSDAIRAAEDLGAFAVLGGPVQTTAFAEELAARGVLCLSCVAAPTVEFTELYSPHVVIPAMAPDQLAVHLAEFVANQLADRPATEAGGDLEGRNRSFGIISVLRSGDPGASNSNVVPDELRLRGIDLVESVNYTVDPATANDQAATNVLRLKDAGVTSVILVADPLTLGPLTRAATAQDWYPEWILSGSLLADTTFLSRTFDQAQWQHAFGITTRPVPTGEAGEPGPGSQLYEWYTGALPPVGDLEATTIAGGLSLLYSAIALAGPDLTADTLRDAVFRIDVVSTGAADPAVSFGRFVWPYDDYFGVDDATVIRWDPEVESVDEQGTAGRGAYRFVDGGARHLPGQWPTGPYTPSPDDPVRLESTSDVPSYPPPPGSPAAAGN